MNLLLKFLNLFFYNPCALCGDETEKIICNDCFLDFKERKDFLKSLDDINVYSWGKYDGKLRTTIISLKNGKKKLSNIFPLVLNNFFKSKILNIYSDKNPNDFLFVKVPSHKSRIEERGYCHLSMIVNEFSKLSGVKELKDFVSREKKTLFMNKLNFCERRANIKNAFKVVGDLEGRKIIILFDDILTSGSTMSELACTIKNKYPKQKIIGLTIASGDRYSE